MVKARKRFGQNFLKDKNIIERIVRTIDPKPGEHLIEIGPGHGAITDRLLQSGCDLDVIEIDRDLAFSLRVKHPDLNIVESDVLKLDLSTLPKGKKIRVVGNLPYNISTPLLFRLFEHLDDIEDMHFMLQLEVVNRLTATHSTSDYGRLSIMSQIYCDSQNMFSVPPEAFTPRPKVMSAIVKLTPHHNSAENVNMERLQTLLTKTFSMRRKTIRNALKGFITAQGLEEIGLDPMLRPENLDLKDYLNILSHFESKASTAK
jgi:16S rRNA (adenine1518-N6/adenine1519-N6)-dimethyltransferase